MGLFDKARAMGGKLGAQFTQTDDLHRAAMFAIDAAGVGGLEQKEVDSAHRALVSKFGQVFNEVQIEAALNKAVAAFEAGKFSFGNTVAQLVRKTETDAERQFLVSVMLDVADSSTSKGGESVDEAEKKHIAFRASQLRVSLADTFGLDW